MEADPRADGSTLSALQARAQAQAERFFGDAAAPQWRPPRRWPTLLQPSRRSIVIGTLALAVALALGIAIESLKGTDEVDASRAAAAAVAAHPSVTTTSTLPSGSAALADPAAVPTSLHIAHDQDLWRIEARGADRLAAARELAALNGLPLQGATELLATTHPLTVSWQGRDASFAWQAVLSDEVNFSLQCRTGHCQVWILSAATAPARGDAGTSNNAPGNRPPEEQDEPSNPGARFH